MDWRLYRARARLGASPRSGELARSDVGGGVATCGVRSGEGGTQRGFQLAAGRTPWIWGSNYNAG